MYQYQINDKNEDIPDENLNNSAIDIKLRRTNNDSSNCPMLHRALSTVSANQTIVNNQRNSLAKNYRRTSINDEIVTIDHNDADASFILPNLYELSHDIRMRVTDNLVDTPTMTSLEETKRVNWWVDKNLPCPKLYPLVTSGDGNCLLHATSLAMWGFHDHSLSMRKALYETLSALKANNSLYRRWRWTQSVQNKKYGLVFSEDEWKEEWKNLVKLSSIEPRVSQAKSSTDSINHTKSPQVNAGGSTRSSSQSIRQYYESLEEFHVYVLANNIRRPIVIYSDKLLRTNDGEAISPIEFGGIYLPLEIPPDKCYKQPVFLAFDAAHFSALVPMENNSKQISKFAYKIPLVDIDTLDLLPIHYFIDPGLNFQWPNNKELSDDAILAFRNDSKSRMIVLEKYMNLSREHSHLSSFPSSMNTNINYDSKTKLNCDRASEINLPNKKVTRSSFNSFSKIIRRKIIHPFSSTKRFSFKHHNHSIPDTSNVTRRRNSSPLFNRHTNILTIVMVNFQPKRPKTSDHMILNYIDACINECHHEKYEKQIDNHNVNLIVHPISKNFNKKNVSLNSLNNSDLRHSESTETSTITLTEQNQSDILPNNIPIDNNENLVENEANDKITLVRINSSNRTSRSNRLNDRNAEHDLLLIDKMRPFKNSTAENPMNDRHHVEANKNGILSESYPSQKMMLSNANHREPANFDKNINSLNKINDQEIVNTKLIDININISPDL